MPDLASSQADAEPHSRLPETSLHLVPRPSKVSRDAASAKSSGNLWESYGEGVGGKHDTLLLPETPKPGPRPEGEGSPVQIFLVNIFWVAGSNWKRAGEIVSVHSQLLP